MTLFVAATSVLALPSNYPRLESPPLPLFTHHPEPEAEPEVPSSEYLPPIPVESIEPQTPVPSESPEPESAVEPQVPSSVYLPPSPSETVEHEVPVTSETPETELEVEPEVPSSEYLPPTPPETVELQTHHQVCSRSLLHQFV